MRYIVKAVYREDIVECSSEAPRYCEWFDFKGHEYRNMLESMWAYLNRKYADCQIQAYQRSAEVEYRGVLHVVDIPYFAARLPDESVISVFKVEVVF